MVTAAAGTQDNTNNNEDSGGGGGMVFRLLCKYLSVGCADEELGRAIVEGESGRVKELLDSGAANALAVHQVPKNTTSNGDTCVSDKNKVVLFAPLPGAAHSHAVCCSKVQSCGGSSAPGAPWCQGKEERGRSFCLFDGCEEQLSH